MPENEAAGVRAPTGMSDARGMLNIDMSRRGTSPVLVGRAAEMAALADAFQTVRQGGPAAVLAGGEAGVGKTRLIGEFAANAREAGARVLTGGCLELGADGLPFAPFTAMLRDLMRDEGVVQVISMLPGGGRATRELARLLPELAVGMSEPDQPASVQPAAGEARARLFEQFLTLLERLAGAQPLVLVVEDAHWADRSSRDLLTFLIRYQKALRGVLIVATFRSDELHRTHPLRPLLAELARIDWVERMELPRLTRTDAKELVAAILGSEPDPELTDGIYHRAEGNPLFTEELLACPSGDCPIPDSLADLLLQTVRRLPEETQEVLRVASAGSGGTSHALLAKVTGYTEDELIRALRPAVTGNVLVTTADGYAFRHTLIREAVHDDLLPGEHGRMHGRFAEAIDDDPSLVPDGRADIEKAHHWYSAHDIRWALISAWQASAQASRAVAHAERLVLLARVLELWDQVPDAAERIGADHVRVLEEAAAAAEDAGEAQRGLGFTEAALDEVDEAADPVRMAMLLRRRHHFRKSLGLPGDAEDLGRALRLVPESLSRQTRTVLLLDMAKCGNDLNGPQYKLWAEEALRYAREAGDLAVESQALNTLAFMSAGPGSLAAPGSEPLRLVAKARAMAQEAGAYWPILKTVITESHLLCGAGDYERAAAVARRGIADAERYGVARTSGTVLAINVAEPLLALGRWDEAEEVAERALDLAPPPLTRVGLWILSGYISLARGDVAAATRRAAAARAVLSGAGYEDQHQLPQALLDTEVALAAEGPAAAVAAAAEALERYDLSVSSSRYTWPLVVVATAVTHQGGAGNPGPEDDAGALLDRLRTLTEKLQVFGPVQRAWQLTFAAIDPPADATPDERLAACDAAVAAWEAVRHPYQTAITLVAGARAALASEASGTGAADKREAAARLRRALPLAGGLGARPLTEEITTLARQAGISLDDGGASGAGTADGPHLTSREFEVLRLVAAGQSNREIAAALFISPKTASVHVSNILGKLGAATRTEAAARAHALHLFDATSGTLAP
jgi:DNA-binding NarL/FixJ family response regulator/tetratricopeptide (TPR) repeat protein